MRNLKGLILLWSFMLMTISLLPASGQPLGDERNSFPLQPGNSWTYLELIYGFDNSVIDTVYYGPFLVIGNVSINDHDFSIFNSNIYFEDTLRVDEAGNVRTYSWGEESILFDFSVSYGETYSYSDVEGGREYEVFVSLEDSVDTPVGTFVNCRMFYFETLEYTDSNYQFVFCGMNGVVKMQRGMGERLSLSSGLVDGRVVVSTERTPVQPGRDTIGQAFPNPARTRSTVKLTISQIATDVELSLIDVLGRVIEVPVHRELLPGEYYIDVDVSTLSSGVYYYRLRSAGGVSTLPVVVTK